MKKATTVACVRCGKRAEPFRRAAVVVDGRVMFPAQVFERTECLECEEKRFAAEEEERVDRITRERYKHAGLADARLQGLEFRHYRTDTRPRERVAGMVRPLYSRLARTGTVANLVLSGGAGTGKTHLAVCFAKAAVVRGQRVRFALWPELCLEFRSEDLHGRKLQMIDKLTNYDVLVLDDIGAEKATEFVVENLYMLVEKWWRRDKAGLILTTNLPIGKLGETYGDRVSSRLAGMSTLVDFEGCPDGRLGELDLQ